MPALLLITAALAALWFMNRKGGTPGTVQGAIDSLLGVGRVVEAFAKGESLGFISVYPIGGTHYLREDAAKSWKRLAKLAEEQGVPLLVNSAFRFPEEQADLYSRFLLGMGATAARPGYSNHQNGVAIDVSVQSSKNSPTYLFLARVGPDFGWTNVGARFSSPEYWHWEYSPQGDLYYDNA